MGAVNLADYKNLYLETGREYLETLKKSLDVLEQNQNNQDALSQMFIAAHSLRSQSQVMNYTEIASLSESIEKQSRDLLDKKEVLNTEVLSMLKNTIDALSLEFGKFEKVDAI